MYRIHKEEMEMLVPNTLRGGGNACAECIKRRWECLYHLKQRGDGNACKEYTEVIEMLVLNTQRGDENDCTEYRTRGTQMLH